MLTIIFVGLIAMFAVAGVFISMEAKRRGESVPVREGAKSNIAGPVGRATTEIE